MTYLILAFIAVILLLTGALAIAVKTARSRCEKILELRESLRTAEYKLRMQGEYQERKEEAQKNADEKKETLHTGDDVTNFGNSLDLLHNASKNRGG